ncbi:MAG: divalent-cation tolerance protein CutA [Candidatus Omnitrophica bacterium CG11_big_fil_rev_8_21_14_0_20_64_10]|nr:MAG: divalent-cation tolerance protein CutA [Candidatus Omnitrophica bacterium CG11_big_fil_rev_8_21_14_0_20_64_10]
MPTAVRLFLTTVATPAQARKLARLLIARRAAACVSILPGAESHYCWKGRILREKECLLLIKSSRNPAQVRALIRDHHPYELPELIALPIGWGEPGYLAWVRETTR